MQPTSQTTEATTYSRLADAINRSGRAIFPHGPDSPDGLITMFRNTVLLCNDRKNMNEFLFVNRNQTAHQCNNVIKKLQRSKNIIIAQSERIKALQERNARGFHQMEKLIQENTKLHEEKNKINEATIFNIQQMLYEVLNESKEDNTSVGMHINNNFNIKKQIQVTLKKGNKLNRIITCNLSELKIKKKIQNIEPKINRNVSPLNKKIILKFKRKKGQKTQ